MYPWHNNYASVIIIQETGNNFPLMMMPTKSETPAMQFLISVFEK